MIKVEGPPASSGNRPTHNVVYQPTLKNGYGNTVRLGVAWVNRAGGISFPAKALVIGLGYLSTEGFAVPAAMRPKTETTVQY